jgi:hypothetical protein
LFAAVLPGRVASAARRGDLINEVALSIRSLRDKKDWY